MELKVIEGGISGSDLIIDKEFVGGGESRCGPSALRPLTCDDEVLLNIPQRSDLLPSTPFFFSLCIPVRSRGNDRTQTVTGDSLLS